MKRLLIAIAIWAGLATATAAQTSIQNLPAAQPLSTNDLFIVDQSLSNQTRRTGVSTLGALSQFFTNFNLGASGTINFGGFGTLGTSSFPANYFYQAITSTTPYVDNIRGLQNTSILVASPGEIAKFGGTRGVVSGGSSYVTGVYYSVSLTGGSGTGALANIVVDGTGKVIVCDLVVGGQNYLLGDTLSVNNSSLGGSGSGFSTTVANNGGGGVGNAADVAVDAYIGVERSAWGMNAVANAQYHSGNPMFYVGIGNCCSPANDTYDWDFAINNEHSANANNMAGTAYTAFRISGKNGDLSFYNRSNATKFYVKESSGNTSVGSGTAAASQLGVFGGVTIGAGIAGTTAAQTNGLLVQGPILANGLTVPLSGISNGLLAGSLVGSQPTGTTGFGATGAYRDDYNTGFSHAAIVQHASSDTGSTAGFSNAGLQQIEFVNVGSASVVLFNTNGGADFVFAPVNTEQFRIKSGGGLAINGVAAVSCSGALSGSAVVTNGIVTHC